ncbi:anti-sigma factor [Ilumatobacter nonamiensis]|uniref:anti-sigma factor n=1 Tax=Ilumatobacter nonamiensis TaxID=467093 RepID=UPI00034617A9|nr:anti-sigma factor [Ilumatobacter nonamiensis]
MNDRQSHDERLDELLALAALGELTDADERELDAALAADVGLQSELDADLDVAAQIQAVNTAQPPAGLKDRVMAAVDTPIVATDVPTPPAPRPVADLGIERERRRSRWIPMAAAAAVALLAVAGVVMINDDGGDGGDLVAEVIEAPDADVWEFDGELSGPLRAVYSPEVDALVLEGTDVDSLTDAETYQLWTIDDAGQAESVGVFVPEDDGSVLFAFAGADPDERLLGITVEPAGGSDQPTSAPIAAVDTTA